MVNWKYTCKRCPGDKGYLDRHTLCPKKIQYTKGNKKFDVPCGKPRKQRNDIGKKRQYDNSTRKKKEDGTKRTRKEKYNKNVKTWLKPYWWNQLEGWAVNVFTYITSSSDDDKDHYAFNVEYAMKNTSEERFKLVKETFLKIMNGDIKTKYEEHKKELLQALKMFFSLKDQLKSTIQRGNIRTYSKAELEDALDSRMPMVHAPMTVLMNDELAEFVKEAGIDGRDYKYIKDTQLEYPKSNEGILRNYEARLTALMSAPNTTMKDDYINKKGFFHFFKELFRYTAATPIPVEESARFFEAFLNYQRSLEGRSPRRAQTPQPPRAQTPRAQTPRAQTPRAQTPRAQELPPEIQNASMNDDFGDFDFDMSGGSPSSTLKEMETFLMENGQDLKDFIGEKERGTPLSVEFKYKLLHRFLHDYFESTSYKRLNPKSAAELDQIKHSDRTGQKVSRTTYTQAQLKTMKEKWNKTLESPVKLDGEVEVTVRKTRGKRKRFKLPEADKPESDSPPVEDEVEDVDDLFAFPENVPKQTDSEFKKHCSNSDICLLLGHRLNEKIREYFNYFTDFQYLYKAKRLKATSTNGFVHQLSYKRDGYDAYAIMKSSNAHPKSDNLMYEYFAGLYLNSQAKLFPSFVETYGVLEYVNSDAWSRNEKSKLDQYVDLVPFKNRFKPMQEVGLKALPMACADPKLIAVVIQNVPYAKNLYDLENVNDILGNLFAIYYQIYYPLSLMDFTHYDLHQDNVLLFEPSELSYIQYYYHNPDGTTTTFKSNYVAKIIDYGRCYFNSKQVNSVEVGEALCQIPECNKVDETCGNKSGFAWLGVNEANTKDNYFIKSTVKSNSVDLRYFKVTSEKIGKKLNKLKQTVFVKQALHLLNKTVVFTEKYGTASIDDCGNKDQICTVTDMRNMVAAAIRAQPGNFDSQFFQGMTHMADLHVYPDKPYKYVPI